MRPSKRESNELRNIKILRNYLPNAEGSALIEFGNTKVLCAASISKGVPRFLKDSGQGWVTAEYGMLPRSTNTRMDREAVRGKQNGRTQEIQRLIGRSLRSIINLKAIGENTITVDCDVIQADGGTRTASITGGCVALIDAVRKLQVMKALSKDPVLQLVAAVSVGICDGELALDLDYAEDCCAATDMNVVMTEAGEFIEVQGTAEKTSFSLVELNQMLELAQGGIKELFALQRAVLK